VKLTDILEELTYESLGSEMLDEDMELLEDDLLTDEDFLLGEDSVLEDDMVLEEDLLEDDILEADLFEEELFEELPNVPSDVMGSDGWTAEEESGFDDAGREEVKKKLGATAAVEAYSFDPTV